MPASLHASGLLEMVLPGFTWLTPGSFFLGLVESLLYGAYAGLAFVPVYNAFTRRWGAPATQGHEGGTVPRPILSSDALEASGPAAGGPFGAA